jgi:DNA polymerase III epsilon subunit-like protein
MYKLPDSYLALDTETNGLPKAGDFSKVDITEIGWVEVRDRQVVGERNWLCKPIDKDGKQISQTAKIVEITGITDELLASEMDTVAVMKLVLPILLDSDLPLVGSNIIGFDKHLLDKYCDILGLPLIDDRRYVDNAALFKSYRRAHSNGHTDWDLPNSQDEFYKWAKAVLAFSWRQDMIKYNVDAALGYLAVPLFGVTGDRHRAVFDCKCCALIIERLREEMNL